MSKKQWGHGFHTGKAAAKKDMKQDGSFPVGYFFLTHDANGNVQYQGKVTGRAGDTILVRYFSWMDGYLTEGVSPLDIVDTRQWAWYETVEDMRNVADKEWEELVNRIYEDGK